MFGFFVRLTRELREPFLFLFPLHPLSLSRLPSSAVSESAPDHGFGPLITSFVVATWWKIKKSAKGIFPN